MTFHVSPRPIINQGHFVSKQNPRKGKDFWFFRLNQLQFSRPWFLAIEIRTKSGDVLGAMVHACVTMLSDLLETLGKGKLIKHGHAHAAREHGTRLCVSMALGCA